MEKEKNAKGLLRRALWTMLFMLFATTGLAQDIVVKGNVKDAMGEPIVGATVQVEGVVGGVITDVNGDFSIKCTPKSILNISYVGFTPKKVAVSNRQNVDIIMGENATDLNEVVVTALGIKREAKALGYAVSEVKTDEIKQANTISPVAALQGKVAGLEINQSDGGMFGSTKILLRGASTLSQKNNQPIFVVDGVILDNPSSNTGDADWDSNINDYGNQLKNLNPDDFASVSVLKGAAATALYGSRGLNGAVVITTKKGGKSRGLGITFSQTFGVDNVYKSPDLQNEYLEGAFAGYNLYGDTYTETGSRWDPMSYSRNSEGKYSMIEQHGGYASEWAWGPHISWAAGKEFEQYDGTYGPINIYKDNYKDAYDTGFNTNTNISLQGGNDNTTFYVSASYKYNKGTTPRNTFNRYSFLGKASQRISKHVSVDFSINFVQSTPRNAQRNIGEYFLTSFMREYDVNKYKHLYKGPHGGLADGTYGDLYRSVPGRGLWWSIYEDDYKQVETTVRPTVNITVNATDWLTFNVGGNLNYYYIDSESKNPGSGYANEGGSYSIGHQNIKQENAYIGANIQKQLNDDIEIHGFLREEYFNQHAAYHSESTSGGLVVHNQYFIGNSVNQASFKGYKYNTKRIVSTLGQIGMSWKDQLFLDITGRNDWSSSLVYTSGRGNFSYFYPSVSGSWIVTETFKDKLPEWITFGKIRASWAQVGNDTDPYYINSGYNLVTYTKNGSKVYGLELPRQIKSTDLKPEKKTSWEVGLDWHFFNNRIGLDFTYYKENTKNQIMAISVPSWSGVSSELVNAGNIQNSGVELALNTTPLKTKDWQWDLNFTYTKNDNKIVELHPDVANYITLDGSPDYGNYRIGSVAKVGGSYGLLMSDNLPKRDENGRIVASWNSTLRTPYAQRSGTVEEIGSMIPDFLGSLSTTLRYKNFRLYVMLDGRFGGYVASYGSHYGNAYGVTGASLDWRKGITWESKEHPGITYTDGFIPDVVFGENQIIDGVDVSGMTYQECFDKGIVEYAHLTSYYYIMNNWGQGVINDDWFKKLNYISLREISLSYDFPHSIYKYIGAKSLSMTLTGRNLGYLLNTAPNHENPESVRGTGAAMFRMRSFAPYTAQYLFTINASF